MGDLNVRVGTLNETAPMDLFEGLEHLGLPTIELGQGGAAILTRNNMDEVVNPLVRDLINMYTTRDVVIANGRSADGYCTYYADNMLGRSSADLCVISTTLYPSIGRLVVLPKWECLDHLPVKILWFASGWLDTQPIRLLVNLTGTRAD